MKIEDRIADYIKEGKGNDGLQKKLMDFFKENPSPPDSDVHAFSDKEKIDTHKFEAYIYEILGSFLGAGRAKEKGFEEKDADPKELAMGVKIEMEHTTNPLIAKRIALDHLAEHKNSDYYTRLKKMEDEMNKV